MNDSDWPTPGRGFSQPRHQRRRPKSVLAPPGYYKPAPLRWPFLVAQMALLVAAIGFLLGIQQTLPNSDHSAVVDGQHMARSLAPAPDPLWDNALELRRFARQRRQLNSTADALKTPQPPTSVETPAHATTTASTLAPSFSGVTMSSITQLQSADTSSGSELPLSTTSTSVAATLGKSFENHPGETFGPPTGETKKPTTQIFTSIANSTSWTVSYRQLISKFPGHERTAIAPVGSTVDTDDGFEIGGTDTPQMSTESVITGGTTTAIEITSTFTPPARTIVDSSGNAVVSSPPPERVVTTITGIIGGSTVLTTRTDNGLTAETSTLTTSRHGKIITVVIVSTPGLPSTVTAVSIISGTPVMTSPLPVTFTRDLGNGVRTVITRIPTPYVIATHGRTTTMVFTTTPGRIVTTTVATTINGTPTMVQTVMTTTPTPRVPIRVVKTKVVTTINGTPNTILSTITLTAAPTGRTSGDSRSDYSGFRILPGFTPAQYFAVTYLPAIIAACLAMPFGIISSNARLMQPFHALSTRDGGAHGADSLTLDFGGLHSVTVPFVQAFSRGEPVPLLASLGAWLSTLLAPLAAEAIGFKVHGLCTHLDIAGCGITPGVSSGPANALVAVLVAMLVLLVATAFMLRRWETGVHADPLTLVAVASMSHSERLRAWFQGSKLQSESDLRERLKDGRFQLAVFDAATGADGEQDDWEKPCYEYGIIPITNPPSITEKSTNERIEARRRLFRRRKRRHMPFVALTYKSRIAFFSALVGLIALIGYYFQVSEVTPFELFMDSQGFGVKFLFALLGTAIALFWRAFFEGVAAVGLFARMARQPCLASQSILLSPCTTNIMSGAAVAVRQRHGLLLAAALMTGIAEIFLPALLANVPFALTQTYAGWVTSTAASLAVLSAMVAVLLVSLVFSRWPHMPVDPRTLAGAIYYFSESSKLRGDLYGRRVALLDDASRDAEVKALGRRFVYVPVELPGKGFRMAVEVEDDDEEARGVPRD